MGKAKRMFCLMIAAVLVISMVLTGCGDKETAVSSQSTGAQSSTASATVNPVEQLEPVTLSWYFFSGVGQQKDQQEVEAKMTEYLKDKINASVKLYPLDWDTFITKTSAMSASGEPYDLCFTASYLSFQTNALKNWFADLNQDGLLDKYGAAIKERLGEVFLKGGQLNGKQFALPTYKERARSSGLFFNKEYVDKYNINISKVNSNRDLGELLKLIKENEKDLVPLGISPGNSIYNGDVWTEFEPLAGDTAVPGDLYADKDDTKVVNRFETPEYMEKCRILREWYKAGYIDKDAAAKTSTYDQKKKNGNYFVVTGGTKPGADAEMSKGGKVTWVQKAMTKTYSTDGDLSGSMNAISATSENKERAMMLLNLMYTDKEFNNLFNFGIEGKHYTKVSENVIKFTTDSGYNFGAAWMFGDQTLNYLSENEDPQKWQKFEEFNNQAVPFKSLGFQFNADPWKKEYAAVKSVIQEMGDALDVGAVDPEVNVPKFIEKLKKAGTDKYIPVIQQEFDKWYAEQKK